MRVNGFTRWHKVSIGACGLAIGALVLWTPTEKVAKNSAESALLSPPISRQLIDVPLHIDAVTLPQEINGVELEVGQQDSTSSKALVPSAILDEVLQEQSLGGSGDKTLTPWLMAQQIEQSQPWQQVFGQLQTHPKHHYTLQIGRFGDLLPAWQWLEKHDLSSAWIYPDITVEHTAYVVIIGNFASKLAAQKAKKQLASTLPNVSIRLKTYKQVQQSLENVKKIGEKV